MVPRRSSNDSAPNSSSKSSPSSSNKRHLRSKNRGRNGTPAYTFDFDCMASGAIKFDESIPICHYKQIQRSISSQSLPIESGNSNNTHIDVFPDKSETTSGQEFQARDQSKQNLESASSKHLSSSSSALKSSSGSDIIETALSSNRLAASLTPVSSQHGASPQSITVTSASSNNSTNYINSSRSNQKNSFTLFSYAGIPTGRRHTPDPLAASVFEPFHKHMARVEKRSRLQERERSVSEHARLTEIKEELNSPIWKSVLPKITKIQNPRNKTEMETKKKKTLDEIDYFLKRYSQFKNMEKKMVQNANATAMASAAAGVGVIDFSSSSNNSSRRKQALGKSKTQAVSTISSQHRKGKIRQLINTRGVTHNTFDNEEPGVDSLSSDDPGTEFSDDEKGDYEYQWEYDGRGIGIRATQK